MALDPTPYLRAADAALRKAHELTGCSQLDRAQLHHDEAQRYIEMARIANAADPFALPADTAPDVDEAGDLLYEAWGIIANANEGNWDAATPEWKAAAEQWRDRWHAHLGAAVPA